MLRPDSLFGKREVPTPNPPVAPSNASATTPLSGAQRPALPPSNTPVAAPAARPESVPGAASSMSSTNEIGSKLIVGPNIKLKGVEITDCDTLVVEGRVEATMDSRVIQIAERGAFKGSAEIDIAEIRGEFDGDLTVRQKLMIYSSGRVSGKIRYGKVVIEEGGQLTGDVQVGTEPYLKGPGVAHAA